jgi:hypothetical protein
MPPEKPQFSGGVTRDAARATRQPEAPQSAPIELRCPTCGAQAGYHCTSAAGRTLWSYFHKNRPNAPGFAGRDAQGRQFCLTCERWKFPAIHSCPGVPQLQVQAVKQPPGPEPVRAEDKTAAALLLIRKRIQETADPVELAGYLAQVGEFVLSRLGFDMTERADVSIDIGADEDPDVARITLTWPLPEDGREQVARMEQGPLFEPDRTPGQEG